MKNIVFITNNDCAWNLPMLNNALYELSGHHKVCSIILVPDKIGRQDSTRGLLKWYISRFGTVDFIRLSIFAFFRKFFFFAKTGLYNMKSLADRWDIPLICISSDVKAQILSAIQAIRPDTIISHTTYTLPDPIYRDYTVIEHHGTLYSEHDSTMGYIKDTLKGTQPSCGFFRHTPEGLSLLVKRKSKKIRSMTGHYIWVFRQFSHMLGNALTESDRNIDRIISLSKKPVPIQKKDIRAFREKNFSIIKIEDILKPI